MRDAENEGAVGVGCEFFWVCILHCLFRRLCVCLWCSAGRCMCVCAVRTGHSFCPLVMDGFTWCDCCSISIINAFRSRRVSLFFSPRLPLSPLRSLSFFHQERRIPLLVAFRCVVRACGIEIYLFPIRICVCVHLHSCHRPAISVYS